MLLHIFRVISEHKYKLIKNCKSDNNRIENVEKNTKNYIATTNNKEWLNFTLMQLYWRRISENTYMTEITMTTMTIESNNHLQMKTLDKQSVNLKMTSPGLDNIVLELFTQGGEAVVKTLHIPIREIWIKRHHKNGE